MKRALYLLVSGLFFFFVSQSIVSAADPPHNEAGGIGCSDCHGMSLVQNSPFWTTNTVDAAYNSICGLCHGIDDPGPPYGGPNAPQTHSHAPGGGAEIRCSECHHNHDQDQIYSGKNFKSQFFIATASGTGVTYNSGTNTTDITYNPATWSGIGKWSDPALLDEKTNPGRGAQLVPDRTYRGRWAIFMVSSINTATNTITVKGNVTALLRGAQAAAPFPGLFYGQLIRRTINNTSVRLWNNEGSNSFTNTAATGTCQVCHTATNHFQSTPGAAPGGDNHNVGSNCSLCHSHRDTSGSGEAFKPSIDHDGTAAFADGPVDYPLVASADDCDLCHAGDTISGSDTHKGQCALCHDTVDYSFKTVAEIQAAAGGRAVVDYMPTVADGTPNTCSDCHGTHLADWYFHDVDHVVKGWVAPNTDTSSNTVNCTGCHSYTGNDRILLAVHDLPPAGTRTAACRQCHLDADKSLTGSATDHGELGLLWGNPNQCASCHTAYFEGHDHHDSVNNGVSYEIVGLDGNAAATADNDTSQAAETGCAECHKDLTGDNTSLNSWTGIAYEHDLDGTKDAVGACVNCHDYDGSKSAPQGDVDTAISSGNAASCATCHTDKVPNIDHGGHDNAHFGWDGNCADCHATANNYVVQEVHTNTCTICHSGTANRDSEKLGDALNGVDGDARLANGTAAAGTWSTPKCSTCHPSATYDLSTIHHDSKNDYAVNDNCTQCHTDNTSYAGDHTLLVSLATNCADCHNGTQGNAATTFNIPVGTGDNKIHDGCLDCHNADNDATLKGPYGVAQAMPDGGVGSNNGGGDCEACHTSTFVGYHQTVDHTSMVATYVNCSTCHTATGNTTGPSDPKVHDACSTCHDVNNGRLTGSASGNNGAGDGGNDGGGNCAVCHNEYFDSHTNIDHSATVALDSDTGAKNDCFDCHSGTEGTSTTVPTGTGDDKLHDNCSICHTTTGILTGTSAIASAMPDGGTAAGKDGGSVVAPNGCQACHGSYFDSHVHGNDGNHDLTYTPTVDLSQDAPGTPCASCHTATGGLTTWTGIVNEHSGSCSTCHDYSGATTVDGTPPVATNDSTIVSGTGNTCVTCHTPKVQPATHGGHADNQFGWAGNCESCHGAGSAAEAVVSGIHSNTCDLCHTAGTYNATSEKLGDNGDGDATLANGAAAAATPFDPTVYTCTTCHNQAQVPGFHGTTIAEVTSSHQLSSDSTGGYDCEACHSTNVANEQLSTHMPADTVANCATICHANTTSSGGAAPTTAKAQIDAVTWSDPAPNQNDTKCENCHIAKGDYKRHGLTDDTGADGIATEHNNLSVSTNAGSGTETDCAECHSLGTVTTRLQMHTQPLSGDANTCLTCHTAAGAAPTAINAGKSSAGTPTAQTCESCHAAKGAYTRHGLTDDAGADGVVDVHDQLSTQSGTATSTCSNCHSAAAQINRLQLHTQATTPTTCLICHQSGTPVSTVIAAGWAATPNAAQCDECHTAIGADWTVHNVDHAAARVTPDTNCTSCHDGNPGTNTSAPNSVTSPYVGGTENHNPTGCYTCHNNVDVANRGTYLAVGAANAKGYVSAMPAGGGNCSACHGAYFDGHVHGAATGYVNHDVTFSEPVDRSQQSDTPANACDQCHTDNSDGTGGALSSWTDILGEHVTGCARCHSYTDDGDGTPLESEVAAAMGGSAITCVTCHKKKEHTQATSTHGGHAPTHFGGDAQCTICHTGAEVVADIHANTCDLCHTTGGPYNATTEKAGANGDGDATLANGSAAAATPFDPTVYTCTTCHDVTDPDVTPASIGGLHHNNNGSVTYDPTACNDCHAGTSHQATIADVPSDCKTCHTLTPDTNGTGAPVASGDPKVHDTCTTCHEFAAAPDYNGDLITVGPATRGLPVGKLPDGGTIGGIDGGGDCVNCHSVTPKKAYHHTTAPATSGDCQVCHVNDGASGGAGVGSYPGGAVETINQFACRECHVDETQTGLRIVSLRLANGDGTQPTRFENKSSAIAGSLGVVTTDATGYVTAHDITFGSTITVNDYRSCFACHNGSYPGAAAVAPFHGFPGEAATAYIESGNGSFTNKTILGGGTVVLDEFSGSNNLLPLPFVYYHPGHITFRRFGETQTMTRRAAKGSYTENGELYRKAGTYANAIRNNAFQATNIEDYLRRAGNTYPGGECTWGGGNGDGTNGLPTSDPAYILCTERKSGSNPFAGQGHETPVTGYALRIPTIPYTNFSASDGNAPAGTGYGMLSNVPYFSSVAGSNDRVFVNSCEIDTNGALQVVASNDQGCGLLSVTTQNDATGRGTMTLNGTTGYCEKTVASVSPIPVSVDVTTSGIGGASANLACVDNSSNPGIITLSSTAYLVNENGGTATITVSRTGGAGVVAVDYATSNGTATAGSDYTAAGGTLNWADGDTADKTFTISITNDGTTESDETVNIALTNNTGGTTLGTPNTAVLTIVDDDQPGTLAFELTSYSVGEGGASITINVTRTAGSVGAVGVSYATSNGTATAGSDYTAASGTLNWVDADTANKSFAIPITQDGTVEGDETVTLTLSTATGGATIGGTNPVTLTIVDDDNTSPTISISQPAAGSTGQQGTFNITYSLSDPEDAATVDFYYDTTGSGYAGTAITECAGQPEGTNAACTWDTSALADGTYYVYGVADDGVNPLVYSAYSGDLTLTAPTGMTGSDGSSMTGIMPGDNFAVNGSTTVDFTFATSVDGGGGNAWTLMDCQGTQIGNCTGTFSGSGTSWSATIDFAGCDGGSDPAAGLYYLEIDLRDNHSGGIRARAIPITLGTTGEYQKTFSDSGYSVETSSFNSSDMVYLELNSTCFSGCDLASKDEVGLDNWDGSVKHLDKEPWSSCSNVGGNTYQMSFDLSMLSVAFPSGTFWYPGRGRPNDNDDVGLMLEVTAP